MKIPSLFKQYIWLIETIRRNGRMTLGEISELWRQQEESDGQELSRTTFNRHRDSILDIFGVIIECDRKDGYRYYIENEEVLKENSIQNWMFSTLSVSNMLDGNVGLQDRIAISCVRLSKPCAITGVSGFSIINTQVLSLNNTHWSLIA